MFIYELTYSLIKYGSDAPYSQDGNRLKPGKAGSAGGYQGDNI